MALPRGNYPAWSIFGQRILENQPQKDAVGEKIVEMFLKPGQSACITDGSSTLYVGTALFEQTLRASENKGGGAMLRRTIATNNVGILTEYYLWDQGGNTITGNIKLLSPPGKLDADLMHLHGFGIEEEATAAGQRFDFVISSVRAIDKIHGPLGLEESSLAIKKASLRSANRVIFATDHEKLSNAIGSDGPRVYATSREWKDSLENENVYIVSSRHPDVTHDQLDAMPPRNPGSGVDSYLANRHYLKAAMNKQGQDDRFIEV